MQYYSSARLLNFPLACIEKQTVLIIIYNAFYYIDASVLLQSLTKLLARTKRLAVAPPSLPRPFNVVCNLQGRTENTLAIAIAYSYSSTNIPQSFN